MYLLSEELKRYKKEKGLQNFADLLERLILHQEKQTKVFEALFIDEAQDLSLMQWDMVEVNVGQCREKLT